MRVFPHKKTWLTLLLLALLAIPLYYALEAYRSRGKEKAVGIYLVHGGQSFVWIDLDENGDLVVRDGYFYTHGRYLFRQQAYDYLVRFRDGTLFLKQVGEHWTEVESSEELSLALVQSVKTPGDFDLIKADFKRINISYPFRYPNILSLEYYKTIYEGIKQRLWAPDYEVTGSYQGQSPLPSFLHRINDERLVNYMKKRLEGKFNESDVSNLRELATDFPDDPYIQMHAMDVEANYGDVEKSTSLLIKCEEALRASPDPLLREASKRAIKSVWKAEGRFDGKDLIEFIKDLKSPESNFKDWFAMLRHLRDSGSLLTISRPLVEPALNPDFEFKAGVDQFGGKEFSEFILISRIGGTLPLFDLIQGDYNGALEKATLFYRLGDDIFKNGDSHIDLLGWRFRRESLTALKVILMALPNLESPLLEFKLAVDELQLDTTKDHYQRFGSEEWPIFMRRLVPRTFVMGDLTSNLPDLEEMGMDNELDFRLIEMGLAARIFKARQGEYPAADKDYLSAIAEIPTDPYSGTALKYTRRTENQYTVYSIGPDKVDDIVRIIYSPTNGSESSGDITFNLQEPSFYPFLPNGLAADSATDVLDTFKNGLPPDLITEYYGLYSPLQIYDSTGKEPVRIFSFGPTEIEISDCSNFTAYEKGSLEPIERGFINNDSVEETQLVFYPVAESGNAYEEADAAREEEGEPPSPFGDRTAFLNPNESFDYSNMPIPALPIQTATQGKIIFTLGPRYSPTNGIRSEGQIWIDLPRKTVKNEDTE